MKEKRIHIIINPAAGVREPILFLLNKAFRDKPVRWSVSLTHNDGDAYSQAAEKRDEVDVIAVYGGDGTVVEAAKALYKTDTPLAILPGGSANVIAKDIGIPLNIEQAISDLLVTAKGNIKKVDMAEVNGEPIFLHVSIGLFADFVKETSRELKNILGQAAYGVTTLRLPQLSTQSKYTFTIDGREYERKGVGLHVANSGNLGFTNLSFFPTMSITDGKLDLIFVKQVTVATVGEFVQNVLGSSPKHDQIEYYQGSHIQLKALENQTVSWDDHIREERQLDVHISPQALGVIVPQSSRL